MTVAMRNARAAQDYLTEQISGGQRASEGWRFEIGVCVTHIDQAMPSLVKWRTRGGPLELYGLRSFLRGDVNPERLVVGDSLRAGVAGSADCEGCTLRGTRRCPGLPRAA